MDLKAETRDFLATRRANITPERAGLPAYGGNRRVPGLRREEVAMLAGVSVDYYTRLERGNLSGVSEEVLEALAQALQLSDDERNHLFTLARSANASGAARTRAKRQKPATLRPTVARVLDAIEHTPAFVRNGRLDILGTNVLGRALYGPLFDSVANVPGQPVNTARVHFLDGATAHAFWGDRWDILAHDVVAILHTQAGRNPYDESLTNLVGELSTRSEDFPQAVGLPRRSGTPQRHQGLPPPRRRTHRAGLRGAEVAGRYRIAAQRVHRRGGFGLCGCHQVAGILGCHLEPGGGSLGTFRRWFDRWHR